jgi:hypothetical protein
MERPFKTHNLSLFIPATLFPYLSRELESRLIRFRARVCEKDFLEGSLRGMRFGGFDDQFREFAGPG